MDSFASLSISKSKRLVSYNLAYKSHKHFFYNVVDSYMKAKLPAIKERRESLVAQAKRGIVHVLCLCVKQKLINYLDMQEVEAMKEQLKLALNPKSIRVEIEKDREARKERLATYLLRASRAVDIEMGNSSKNNSILQHHYIHKLYVIIIFQLT